MPWKRLAQVLEEMGLKKKKRHLDKASEGSSSNYSSMGYC